jgi:hypothetical protein
VRWQIGTPSTSWRRSRRHEEGHDSRQTCCAASGNRLPKGSDVGVVVTTEQLREAIAGLCNELALPEPDRNEDLAERVSMARQAVVEVELRRQLHEVALVRLLHIAANEGPAAALIHVADHLIASAQHVPLAPGDPEAFDAAIRRAQLLEDQTTVLFAAAAAADGAGNSTSAQRRARAGRCLAHTPVDGGRP